MKETKCNKVLLEQTVKKYLKDHPSKNGIVQIQLDEILKIQNLPQESTFKDSFISCLCNEIKSIKVDGFQYIIIHWDSDKGIVFMNINE